MKTFIFLLFCLFSTLSTNGLCESPTVEPIFTIGDSRSAVSGKFTREDIAQAIFEAGGYTTSSFTNMGAGNLYYLYSRGSVGVFDVNTKKYGGALNLAPFSDTSLESEINAVYDFYKIKPAVQAASNTAPILGCLAQSPLRYGDFTGDNKPELAVFEQDEYGALNVNVFSAELKKTIFSVRLATYDTRKNNRQTLPPGQEPLATDPLANAPTDGQYLSFIAEENSGQTKGIQKAVINFSKVYLLDADGDAKQDLIVWRKLYQSRENKDPIKGYSLLRDQANFYRLESGEYKRQSSDTVAVKKILEAKQLTWQKGYPSKSECKGQEGQLIPESHDPLLNDPDVLK